MSAESLIEKTIDENLLKDLESPVTAGSSWKEAWYSFVNSSGKSFLFIIGVTYFFQGFRAYAFGDGIIWYYSHEFGIDPGPAQIYMSIILVTWNIKMIYGLIFDNFPLFRSHDKAYMVLAGLISFLGFVALGAAKTLSLQTTTFFFFLALMGMAMSDVIADSMVVKQAKRMGESGGADLQTFCWILMSVGSILGRPFAGTINGSDGSGSKMLLGSIYSGIALFTAFITIFQKESPSNVAWSFAHFWSQLKRLFHGIFFNKKVLIPMSWIVLSAAIVPDIGAAMNFWKKQVIDIGADKQAYIDTVGDVFSIFGLMIYNLWFKKTSFRIIFFWTQLAGAAFAFTDIILVRRWNTLLNLSDTLFLLGSNTIVNTVMQLQSMPFLVMAAQMCPKDIEATFYAAMMSLSNLGGSISGFTGGWLLDALHIVQVTPTESRNGTLVEPQYDFTNLPVALNIRVIMVVVGAVLVLFMIPHTHEIKAHSDSIDEWVELENSHDDDMSLVDFKESNVVRRTPKQSLDIEL